MKSLTYHIHGCLRIRLSDCASSLVRFKVKADVKFKVKADVKFKVKTDAKFKVKAIITLTDINCILTRVCRKRR